MEYKGQEERQKLAVENKTLSWFPNWPDCVHIQFANIGQRKIISWMKYAKQTPLFYVTIIKCSFKVKK